MRLNIMPKVKDLLFSVRKGSTKAFRNCLINFGIFRITCSQTLFKTRTRKLAVVIFPIVAVLAVIVYGYSVPSSQVFGKVYFKGTASTQQIALTFDDGPNEPYTSQILDILEQYDVQATFFAVGRNVQIYPQTCQRMLADGDVIGNHSFNHRANHALTTYGINDMRAGEEAISSVLDIKPRLYRPPHGKLSPWEIQYVHSVGMTEVTWTIEVHELAGHTGTQEAEEIIKKTKAGDIILLHDGYGIEHYNQHADKSATVEAVRTLIPELQAKGYTFVTVPQLLGIHAYMDQ